MTQNMEKQQSRLAGTAYAWSAMRELVALVVGAGAVGGEVIKHLVHLGVRRIIIVDDDQVEASNLSRSVLFLAASPAAIGQPKALVAQRVVRRWRRYTKVSPLVQSIETLGLGPFLSADVVFSCVDNQEARIFVAAQAMRGGVPLVEGGMYPSDIEGMEVFATDGYAGGCGALCRSDTLRAKARHEIVPAELDARLGCTAARTTILRPAKGAVSLSMSASIVAAQMVSLGVRRAVSYREYPRRGTFLKMELCAVGDQSLHQSELGACGDCPLDSARAIGAKARAARARRLTLLRRPADQATLWDVLQRGAATLRISPAQVRVYVDEAFSAHYRCQACRHEWRQPTLIRHIRQDVRCCADPSLEILDRPYLSFHLAIGDALVELVKNTAIRSMGYRNHPGWIVEDTQERTVRVVLAE